MLSLLKPSTRIQQGHGITASASYRCAFWFGNENDRAFWVRDKHLA